jgi:SAM-dependent methyltransferase
MCLIAEGTGYMSTTGRDDATYAMGRTEDETARLIRQAEGIREFTRRFFLSAGIGPGMRVLDVGTGAGDGALLAAEIVGPTGTVVGIDTNAAILGTARERARVAGHDHVTFVPGDFRTAAMAGDFDAVIGRYVLMYLGNPVDALRAALRHLRPGGVAAFQEYEFSLGYRAYPPSPLLDQGRAWMLRAFAAAGVDSGMGFRLYRTLLDAGLLDPEVSISMETGSGPQSPMFEGMASVLRSILPLILAHGIATAAEVDIETYAARFRDEVVSQNGVVYRAATISVWARKPERPL